MWPWRKRNDETYDEYIESQAIEALTPDSTTTSKWDAHIVFLQAEWGEVIKVLFMPEEWEMLHQVSEVSGKELDTVIGEVITERYLNQSL